MNRALIWQIATRYFRGKRQGNAVPILSRISMGAIAVGSGAMLVLFSVFNGFELLVKDMYKTFYPDIKITAARGKFFSDTAIDLGKIRKMDGVTLVTPVIEDKVLAGDENSAAGHGTQQVLPTLKGVENDYFKVNSLKKYIDNGSDSVSAGHPYTAILGSQIALMLGADVKNVFSYILLYYPNPTLVNVESNPTEAYQTLKVHPAGTFSVYGEFDNKYVIAPLALVQELFRAPGQLSSIEIAAEPKRVEQNIADLKKLLGPRFTVASRYEQNKTIYLTMRGEKMAMFAIMLFVVLIAFFNMIGALLMLVLEKNKDIGILRAMGADAGAIRRIFLLEGVLWSFTGGAIGVALGTLICLAQQHFGIIKMGEGFAVDAYPVSLQATDALVVIATIMALGVLASIYPAFAAARRMDASLKSS